MKIQEKFKNTFLDMPYIDNENDYCIVRGCLTEQSSVKCAEIARKIAVDFADWVNLNAYRFPKETTTEELLKIFENN